MIQAAAYARVSTGMQVEAGSSLPSQLAEIRRWGKQNGYEVVTEFVDEGQSARSDARPEFQRLCSMARKPGCPFQAVLVWSWSRFARNLQDAVTYQELLKKHHIELISISEPIPDGPLGELLRNILHSINEFYSADLAKQTLRGMVETAQQGYALGGPAPYGYKKEHVAHPQGGQKVRYAPDPEEAPIVRRVYEAYASGKGLETIADGLNLDGIPTRRGKQWQKPTIKGMLWDNKEVYLGNLIFNRRKKSRGKLLYMKPKEEWIIQKGTHEPIITRELAKAVEVAKNGRGRPRKADRPLCILKGLVRCAECGYSVHANWRGDVGYFRCSHRRKIVGTEEYTCSNNRSIREDWLEDAVLKDVRKKFLDPEFLDGVIGREKGKQKKALAEHEKKRKGIQKRLDALSRKRDNLVHAIEEGASYQDLGERLEQIRRQITEAEAEVLLLQKPDHEIPLDVEALVVRCRSVLDSEDREEIKSLLRSLVSEILLSRTGARIHYRLSDPALCGYLDELPSRS